MIVNYPYLVDVAWKPRGMRKDRAFAVLETVSIEIEEIDEAEAPVVLTVEPDRSRDEATVTYRRNGDDWYRATESSVTAEQVKAEPAVLGLCHATVPYGISRGASGRSPTSSYDYWQIVDGPSTFVTSRAELPEGRETPLPPQVDPSNGRLDEVLSGAKVSRLIGGRLHELVAEPVLRVTTGRSGRYDFVKVEVVQPVDVPCGDATYRRIDDIENLRLESEAAEDTIFSGDKVEIHRSDLLTFDPLPTAVRGAVTSILRRVVDVLPDASLTLLQDFSVLRDECLVLGYDWHKKPAVFQEVVDTSRVYDLLVRVSRSYVETVGAGEMRQWSYKNVVEDVRRALSGTSRHDEFVALFPDVLGTEELQVSLAIDEDDLAALTRSSHANSPSR